MIINYTVKLSNRYLDAKSQLISLYNVTVVIIKHLASY